MFFGKERIANLSTTDHLETNGLHSDKVAGLHDAGDYLLEAELSLSRDIDVVQREGQLIDLNNAVKAIRNTMSLLPKGQLRNWATCLENRAQACAVKVKGLIAEAKRKETY
ncbi:MAG: hypothetical protein DRP66_10300 [Planctomycetota bacterium]|nr:MAG: hypothetical protein DRP66_10300 [Planctomycetota bacterium]